MNFLKLKGAKWGGENAWCGVGITQQDEVKDVKLANGANGHANGINASSLATAGPSVPTILEKIYAQRMLDVESSSSSPSTTPSNLRTSLALHTAPPLINFLARIKSTPHTAIMAEIKRASPSKGDIAPDTNAPAQALRYAMAGASVISVLTEPKWFKGSLQDMSTVRQALKSLPNRPAVLRKDFIFSEYMIDEARLHGADTVLLIVAMLKTPLLKRLYDYSLSLGMEPLVEVNNPTELTTALEIGAKVIGVNNRNLHDFNVDMGTTSRVNAALSGQDVVLCALSGISSPADVEKYVAEGVRAVLVGESLMRATDPAAFLRSLAGLPPLKTSSTPRPMVKICGCRSAEDAKIAIQAGADLIGIILVPNAKRCIPIATASEIASEVRAARSSRQQDDGAEEINTTSPWFSFHSASLRSRRKPLLVGVFQNQPLSQILHAVENIPLDMVQLHGDEPQSWAQLIPVPVTKVFRVDPSSSVIRGGEIDRPGLNQYILLDAGGAKGGGGEGQTFDWTAAKKVVERGEVGSEGRVKLPIMLAGGLDETNVALAVEALAGEVLCMDVSSGVESDGRKDQRKVAEFVKAVKGL